MSAADPWREPALAVARHLPPSAASLRLLDVGGRAGATLAGLRADLDIHTAPPDPAQWPVEPDSVDAVVAVGARPDAALLAAALAVLRPGGRLMLVDVDGAPDEAAVRTLDGAGFTRILVEAAMPGRGVLMRAEKPHTTADTLRRVAQVAARDAGLVDLNSYSGPYVHLLVRQTPNKPVWERAPGERLAWEAAAIVTEGEPALLAFSALPRAVAFMQPAVLAGQIRDVNKVVKFSRATAQRWTARVLLNPPVEILSEREVVFLEIDPATAEAPDE